MTPEPSLEAIKQIRQDRKPQYMSGSIVASRLSISKSLLSRITGMIYVTQTSDELEQNDTRYNIGLSLKFNRKNEEVSLIATLEILYGCLTHFTVCIFTGTRLYTKRVWSVVVQLESH